MAKTEKMNIPAMEEVMYRWLSKNWHCIDDGGCGDVIQLFSSLTAIAEKSAISLCGTPKHDSKSAAS